MPLAYIHIHTKNSFNIIKAAFKWNYNLISTVIIRLHSEVESHLNNFCVITGDFSFIVNVAVAIGWHIKVAITQIMKTFTCAHIHTCDEYVCASINAINVNCIISAIIVTFWVKARNKICSIHRCQLPQWESRKNCFSIFLICFYPWQIATQCWRQGYYNSVDSKHYSVTYI